LNEKMQDHLVRVVSQDGRFRAMAAVTTGLVAEVCARQQTDLTATVALGRLVTGGALLGCLLKGAQRLALMVEGNGPLGKLSVETDAQGRVRGSVRQPLANLPPRGERFDVAGAIGRAGFLHVLKDFGLKEPYRSMVQLQSSEIGDDLAYFLTTSEQVPSSVALGVELAADGSVAAAGGFIVQALPPGDAGQIEQLEQRLRSLPPTTSLLKQGKSPAEILAEVFRGVPFAVQQQQPLSFYCPCSPQQIADLLRGLGRQEVQALLDEEGQARVTCEYCKQVYAFDRAQLQSLLNHL
jgi:molecular chaperone Hsp33